MSELQPLPEPFDYFYEWDSQLGKVRKFSQAPHNGQRPDRSVPIFTADQMRAYALENRRAQPEPAMLALENCRLFAARHRKEEWASTIRRFCAEAGVMGSPLREAQPAAPADAEPSVAPEPVAWLSVDCIGERYLCFSKPMDNDTVTPLFAHPPRAPLTEEHVTAVVRSVCPNLAETSKAWRDLVGECRYWLEAAHGIGGK